MNAKELRELFISLDDGQYPDSMDDVITHMLALTTQRKQLIDRVGLSDATVETLDESLNIYRTSFASRMTRLLSDG